MIYYHYIVFLFQLNGNSMCNSKLTEIAVILCYNFSLSDCHFSLIFLKDEVTSPYYQSPAWTLYFNGSW